ncbi:MAG: hypothetical protein ABIW76_06125, partial [Fibrobacteria bacterium]
MRNLISGSLKIGMLCLGSLASLSQAAWVHFDPEDTVQVPKKFSQTGFYTNMTAKTVTSEAVSFDVNAPLWSDAAAKKRWVLLKPGSPKIQFKEDDDYLGYPDGTVFVKLFQHDTVPGDTTTRMYWETRLLVKKSYPDTVSTEPLEVHLRDIWYPFSYKWKRDGSEAFLVSQKGLDTVLTLTVNGQKRLRKWSFPSVRGCNACHREYTNGVQGRNVLGFFAPQLNRPSIANPTVNQIRDLFNKGILAWSKPAAPTDAEIGAMPKWARLTDTSPLDLRARSYIAANCSGCHGDRGKRTEAIGHSDINYDFFKLSGTNITPAMELRNVVTSDWDVKPIVTEKGDTLVPALVVPGYPQLSILLKRLSTRNLAMPSGLPDDTAFSQTAPQMPPLGVFEVDTAAVRVVTEWITTMPNLPPSAIRKAIAGRSGKEPVLRGDMLVLPEGVRGKAVLLGLDGRRHELIGISG